MTTNNDTFINDLASFAMRFGVSIRDVYTLPAIFENAAQKAGMKLDEFTDEAVYKNRPLGEYLADCAARVAEMDRKGE